VNDTASVRRQTREQEMITIS